MSKKRGSVQQLGPEVMDMDTLAILSDDDLSARFHQLDAERETMRENRVSTLAWEIEIAYMRREQQMRRVRRDRHDAYLMSLRGGSSIEPLSDEFDDGSMNPDFVQV